MIIALPTLTLSVTTPGAIAFHSGYGADALTFQGNGADGYNLIGAGMWLAGGVGLSVGLGYWAIAAFSALACLVVLNLLGRLEAQAGGDAAPSNDDPAQGEAGERER